MEFKITNRDGAIFSKESGDTNPIHLNDLDGYNSIFGEKICHGCLVLIKFLNKIDIERKIKKRDQFLLDMIFYKHFSYEKKIIVRYEKKFIFYQSGNVIAELKINFLNKYVDEKLIQKKILKLKKKKIQISSEMNNLDLILKNLTNYVGTTYPGKNSIIRDIKINFNEKHAFYNDKMIISSKKKDKRFPIINNSIKFRNYIVNFQTLIRPTLSLKKIKLNKEIKNEIKKTRGNILILGASSGIGNELLNIFKLNKKINIFASYYKNKIKLKRNNVLRFKLDIEKKKSIKKILKITKKFDNLKIFYFATPKIDINTSDKETYLIYKNYYIDYPLKLLKFFKNKKLQFFYPSTIFINQRNSAYSKTKKQAEKKLKLIKNKNVKINILRINEINTKQNLSLVPRKLPSFIELLMKNKIYQTKVFFKN